MRHCKDCGVEVGKGRLYCSPCKEKRRLQKYEKIRWKRRKYTICGFEGCKEPRGFWIHSCEYHKLENRKKRERKRYLEGIVSCIDCGCDIGKRIDNKFVRHCNDCLEIRKEVQKQKQPKYYRKWFKNKYHTDDEFRKRSLEYQRKYKEMRKQNE